MTFPPFLNSQNLQKKLEETGSWANGYKPPSTSKTQLLEPDLSYASFCNTSSPLKARSRNISMVSNIVCWNCNQPGHSFNRCSAARRIFCFGCGTKDFKNNQCSRCSKKRRHWLQENGTCRLNINFKRTRFSVQEGTKPLSNQEKDFKK